MRYDKTFTEQGAANFMTGNVNNGTRLTAAEKRVIAAALETTPATVKRHLENILKKLQLKNRVEAAIYALRSIGCPRGPDPGCPLEVAQEEINLTREKWAV